MSLFSEFEQQETGDLVKCRKCCQAGPGCSTSCAKAGISLLPFYLAQHWITGGFVWCFARWFFPSAVVFFCPHMDGVEIQHAGCARTGCLLPVWFPRAQEDLNLEFICVPMAHETPWLLSCTKTTDLWVRISQRAAVPLPAEHYQVHVVIPEDLQIFSQHPSNVSPEKWHIKGIY